jgi:hypothetical protein
MEKPEILTKSTRTSIQSRRPEFKNDARENLPSLPIYLVLWLGVSLFVADSVIGSRFVRWQNGSSQTRRRSGHVSFLETTLLVAGSSNVWLV